MLQPKKTKHRKQQKGKIKGNAQRGHQIAFGSFGIKSLEEGFFKRHELTKKISGKDLKINLPNSNEKNYGIQDKFWCMPLPKNKNYKRCVDFQNDVYVSDIELAVREGFRSIEHVKRYTTLGMATDQGRTSNLNGLQLVSNIEKKNSS